MTFKTKVIGKLLNPISGKPAKDATIRFITVEGFKRIFFVDQEVNLSVTMTVIMILN